MSFDPKPSQAKPKHDTNVANGIHLVLVLKEALPEFKSEMIEKGSLPKGILPNVGNIEEEGVLLL